MYNLNWEYPFQRLIVSNIRLCLSVEGDANVSLIRKNLLERDIPFRF